LPIQIDVPVSIEETVCSAYRMANPNFYKPVPPVGYSDFSANTEITLKITRESDGSELYSGLKSIPIEADTCAGLAPFSWTPDASLENESVKFRAETLVIDDQVANGGTDWAEVIETIYPTNLDGACWTRAYDFTLANEPTIDIDTSLAQISEGEYLYATFMAGAWRDDAMTPMDFEARLYIDGNTLVSTQTFSTVGDDLSQYSVNLSDYSLNMPVDYICYFDYWASRFRLYDFARS